MCPGDGKIRKRKSDGEAGMLCKKKERRTCAVLKNFCKKHNFSTKSIVLSGVVIAIAVLFSVYVGIGVSVEVSSRPIMFGLRDIGELSTQAGYYTNVQVIEGSRTVFGIEVPFTQSKYVFSYDGVIKAGLDFSLIELEIDPLGKKMTVMLPEIKILSNEIDEGSLEVYDESKNIFSPLHLEDMNSSLGELKRKSQETAIENGLLDQARANAELLIEGFLLSYSEEMGQYDVVFEWSDIG